MWQFEAITAVQYLSYLTTAVFHQCSSSASPLPQMLGLRSSLELRLANHHALAVVFQLECVFSAPIGRETMVRGSELSLSQS